MKVNGIFTSILILIVLFVLAPLFKTLPNVRIKLVTLLHIHNEFKQRNKNIL